MMTYRTTEGKHGTIYHVTQGIYVATSVDKTWEVIVKLRDLRQRKRFGHNLEKALKFAELVAAKLGLQSTPEPTAQEITVEEVAKKWISTNGIRWTPNTLERYSQITEDYIKPSFGIRPCISLTRMEIKDWLVDLSSKRKAKTVELTHSVLSSIMMEAMEIGLITENPASGLLKRILPPKNRRVQSPPDPFSKEDLATFLSTAWQILPKPLALLLETLGHTGMRLGEGLAFNSDNLDVKNCQYMVKEARKKDGSIGATKTGEQRLIDLGELNARHIQSHIRQEAVRSLPTGNTYLFGKFTHRHVQRAVERVCKRAGLRVRHPHSLRHTYASILLMDHYSLMYVQKQLGHSSIRMTCDTYGHWIPGEGRRDLGKTLGMEVEE